MQTEASDGIFSDPVSYTHLDVYKRQGYNFEAYHAGSFREAGLDMVFVQDNLSMSAKGTLRGMHFQKNYQQGKLVCVVCGEVFDAVVDIREGSRTYGQWFGTVLSAEKKNMLYVPCLLYTSIYRFLS